MAGGNVNADLARRYADIQPEEERIAAIQGWVEPRTTSAASAALAPPRPDIQIERPAPPPTVVAAAPAPVPAPARPEPAPVQAEPIAPAAEPAAAPEPAKETVAATEAEPEAPAPAKVVAAPLPSPSPVPFEDDDEEEFEELLVTAESLLVRQRYVSDVLRQTMQNMRYPRRALDRHQQGSIRLVVTVKRSGELQEVQVLEESPYSLLNREAVASVERASPFPAVPDGIIGDSLSFGIPVTFQLQ